MGSILYQLAEGIEAPAEYAEDLARELDFAAAAEQLTEAAAQALDLARSEYQQARTRYYNAVHAYGRASRTEAMANALVNAILRAAGLVRTAAGIMPHSQALAAQPGLRCSEAELRNLIDDEREAGR